MVECFFVLSYASLGSVNNIRGLDVYFRSGFGILALFLFVPPFGLVLNKIFKFYFVVFIFFAYSVLRLRTIKIGGPANDTFLI